MLKIRAIRCTKTEDDVNPLRTSYMQSYFCSSSASCSYTLGIAIPTKLKIGHTPLCITLVTQKSLVTGKDTIEVEINKYEMNLSSVFFLIVAG